jgi:serine/threonine-protein kinase
MESVPNSAPAPKPVSDQAAPAEGGASMERYGRYQLIEQIGKGGMAEVFRAVTEGVGGFRRVFVIKRIRPEKSDSPEFIRMFCDEARICALLSHPSIVQVYDFGQINGSYFLAMEYLRGKDLSTVMRALRAGHAAMPPPAAASVAREIALGLHHAHTAVTVRGQKFQIVHRDVTPSNIMLLRTGGVKILDFGIAKAAATVKQQLDTGGGRVKGKLAYLSPEQVRAAPEIDGRSDVFSLGVVLWEMLTGQRLFTAENEFQTMRNVLMRPVPPPSSLRAGVPAGLDAIVARALERERGRRYQTAQAFAEELERFLHDVPCPLQAIPRLLQELFGDDVSGEHLPPASRSDLGPPVAVQMAGDSAALEVAIEVVPEERPVPATAAERRDPGRARRRALAVVAGAMLLACLGWAAKSRLAAHRPTAGPVAAAPAAPAAAAPGPPSSPPVVPDPEPAPAAQPALAEPDPVPPPTAPGAARTHHHRAHGVAGGNVTIDPFR